MESVFGNSEEVREVVIPEMDANPPAAMSEGESTELVSQVGVAAQSVGEDPVKLKAVAAQTAVFEGRKGLRSLITESDFEATRRSNLDAIAEASKTQSADILADSMLASIQQERNQFALEDKVVSTLSDSLPSEIRDVVDEDVLTDMAKDQAFALKINNYLAEREDAEDRENLLEEFVDFIKVILPIEVGERLLKGGEGGINDDLRKMLYSAKNLPEDQQASFLRGPVQEFLNDIELTSDNPQSHIDLMRGAVDGSDKELDRMKFFQMIGVVAAPFDLAALKSLKSLNIAKALGNKKILAEDLMKPQAERELIKSDIDVATTVVSLKAPFDQTDGILGEVTKNLDLNRRILEDVVHNFTAPESQAAFISRRIDEFNASYGGERILSSNISLKDTDFIEFSVGTAKGTPFKSEKTAQNLINKHSLDGKVIRHPSGGFSIKLKSPISGIDSSTPANLSWFSKYFGNIDNIIAKSVVAGARSVEGAQNQVFQAARAVFDNSLKVLGTKRGQDTLKIIQKGIDEDKWLTPKQFLGEFENSFKRSARKDEVEAYFGFKQLNDFDYELKNKVLYEDAVSRGDRAYSFNMDDGVLEFNAAAKDSVHIVDNGTNSRAVHVIENTRADSVTLGKGALDEVGLADLRNTHDLIEVNPRWVTQMFEDGVTSEPTRWVFVPKGSKTKGISTTQAPYKAGGRRVNNNPAYLKVGRIKNGSDGTPVRVSDIATHGSISKAKAKESAESLNELFTTIKGLGDDADLSQLDALVASKNLEGIGITTAREAHKFFKSHRLYDYDNISFAGVRDRELVKMSNPDGQNPLNIIDEMEEPMVSNIKSQMNGMRGDRLKNLDGEDGLLLDPMAALASSLDTTARFASVNGYRDHMLAFMREKFGDKLNYDTRANPIEILSAKVHKQFEQDVGMVRAIEAHQRFIEEVVSRRTRWEEEYLQKMENGVNWVFDGANKLSEKFGLGWVEKGRVRKSALDTFGKDPAGRVKNLVFNAKLGLFNIPSTIIQAMNMTNIMSLSPKYGVTAAKHALPARLALVGGVDGAMRRQIAKGWKEAGFKSEDDFFEYLDEFRRLGLGHLDRGIAEVAGVNGSQLGTSKLGAVAEAGRVFFNEGERISRLTSYGAARLRWLDDASINPKSLPATSKEGRLWIQNESHRLSLGLSRQDVQLGFRGLAGLPTQFWSYPFRLTGAILPKALGGGAAFSKGEKARLALMQAFLYGSAGIPIADMVVNHYTAKDPSLDKVAAKALTNGAIDTFIYALSDGKADTNFAGRAGVGQFFTDIARSIRDKSAGEFATGAGGQTLSGLAGTIAQAVRGYGLFRNPTITSATEASWVVLKAEISSLKLADKTVLALRYGHLFAKSGVKYAKINDMTTFLMVAGITPQAYEDLSLTFLSEKEVIDTVKANASMIVSINRQIDDAYVAGDFDKVKELEGVIHILGEQSRDVGIEDEVYKAVVAIEKSEGMLEKRLIKMHTRRNKTPEGSTGVGVNNNLLRKDTEQEQE